MNATDPTVIDPPATTTPPPAPAPTADLMSEPTFEECIEERNRYDNDLTAGRLSFAGIPEGHHVAYFGGRIIDHDADYMTLQARAAQAAGVHWARLVINYPWMW